MAENLDVTRKKWGRAPIDAGFTILPNHLLSVNQFLPESVRLSPTELVVLFQVLSAWWSPERMPFPSKATIAKRTALSPRQVQRAISALEAKGFLERGARFSQNNARVSNVYELDKTVALISEIAKDHPRAFKGRKLDDENNESPNR
ncbi:MAG: helix-turn-helix domain-containing protein [Brevundimonas sp.]|uniref:helix-turn-helix domain-containing protein n=1 Tax=Brevundimonas sp. TaxID=1871086 RepID=UPI00391A3A11